MLRLTRTSTSLFLCQQHFTPRLVSSNRGPVTKNTVVNSNIPKFYLGSRPRTREEINFVENAIKSLHQSIIQKNLKSAQSNFSVAIEHGVSCPELYYDFLILLEESAQQEKKEDGRLLNNSLNYYEWMMRNDVKLDIRLFQRFMNIAKITNSRTTIFKMYEDLKRLGFAPNEYIFTLLIDSISDASTLQSILEDMSKANVKPDSVMALTILKKVGENSIQNLQTVYENLEQSNVPISISAYNSMLTSIAKYGTLQQFEWIIQLLSNAVWDDYTFSGALMGFSRFKMREKFESTKERFLASPYKKYTVPWNIIIRAYEENFQDPVKSEEAFFDMFKKGIPVTSASVKSFMHALANQNKAEKFEQLWNFTVQKGLVDELSIAHRISGYMIMTNFKQSVRLLLEHIKTMKKSEKLPIMKFFQTVMKFKAEKKHKQFVDMCSEVPDFDRVKSISLQKGPASKTQMQILETYFTLLYENFSK